MAAIAHIKSRPAPTLYGQPKRPMISMFLKLVRAQDAQALMAKPPFPGQRPLHRWYVEYLKYLMVQGHFRQGTVITLAVVDKQEYVLNGQHTLQALAELPGLSLWLQEETRRNLTLADATHLYGTYDRNLSRTWADVYGADPRFAEHAVAKKDLRRLGGAVPPLAMGFRQDIRVSASAWVHILRDHYVRLQLMLDWVPEMTTMLEHYAGRGPGRNAMRARLTRAAVLAVALVTYRFCPEQARTFWPAIAATSGLLAGQPAHALATWLTDTPSRRLDTATYERVVAQHWNAYVLGKRQPRQDANQPIVIAGTPHDGRTAKGYLRADGTVLHEPQALTT